MSLNYQYRDKKPIAYLSLSNSSGIEIYDIIYGINDYIVYRFTSHERLHKAKIRYGEKSTSFQGCDGRRYKIDDFMRTNS